MKYRWKKLIALSLVVCMFCMLTTACGSAPAAGNEVNAPTQTDILEPIADESESDTEETDLSEPITDESESDEAKNSNAGGAGDTETEMQSQNNSDNFADTESESDSSGKWHVYDSDVAAATDADFEGVVHKIDTNSFYIYPMEIEVEENGAITSSSLAPGVEISDEELVKVVFDNDTVFILRDIYDGGARYEDSDASFQNIEEGFSVSLKGEFRNDVFYANTVRILKIHH